MSTLRAPCDQRIERDPAGTSHEQPDEHPEIGETRRGAESARGGDGWIATMAATAARSLPAGGGEGEVGVAALPAAVAVDIDEDRAGDRERRDARPVPAVLLVAAGLLEGKRGVAVGGDADPGVAAAEA